MIKLSSPKYLSRHGLGGHVTLLVIIALLPVCLIHADVGGDNPTGISGQFTGNVTTGGSYDPYTANATRSITDLVIAGAVGSYPLAFTRTMNSRYTAGVGNTPAFGTAGTWTQGYQWTIDPVTVTVGGGGVPLPSTYNVNYPDGRRIAFQNRNPLPDGTTDTDFRGPLGVRDRFEQLTSGATECYVRLPDGGRVWFHATTTVSGSHATYTFALKGTIDPFGQTTTVAISGNTVTVTEPAGRWIQIVTRNATTAEGNSADIVVDHILGSDGRSVYYYYSAYITANQTRYTSLTSVRYFGDATWDATYAYQSSNIDPNGRPLISTCADPMFDGPMWKIAYDFATGTNGDGTAAVYGQLLREKHPNGTAVSTLTVNARTNQGYNSRTETRGDGPARTFTYNTYRLKTVTDFKGVATTQNYDNNYYLQSVVDRRGNSTSFSCNSLNGQVKQITYPNAGGVSLDYGGQNCPDPNNRDQYNKYWLYQGLDGTIFNRDTSKRVITADHIYWDQVQIPNVKAEWVESFTYNNFAEVLTHTLWVNGPSETYTFDAAGLPTAFWDAAHPTSGHPTAWFQYDGYGRVSGVTDARGSASGDANYTTTFQYNLRGQVTKLTHPDGTYSQYGYNPDGTLAWIADERHPGAATDATQRTNYAYDDYKRILTVTTPLRAVGDSTNRVTTYNYDPSGNGAGYVRTTTAPTRVTSPGGKVVNTVYDENLRVVSVTTVGDANVSNATTSYTYDANGNILTVKDPNGQTTGLVTSYIYDVMNKIKSVTDPLVADRNSNGHTIDYTYNTGGNLTQETRADGKMCTNTYYTNGWLEQRIGYGGEKTIYTYNTFGQPTEVDFYKGSGTNFIAYRYDYDALARLTGMHYPADAGNVVRSEAYQYDIANHLSQYTNPAGQAKTLTYDNRGRLTNSSWSTNGPSITITYDATRPTSLATADGTAIVFGYDEANNKIYEDQTTSGLPTRRVQRDLDADGNRSDLLVETGNTVNFANYFDYTSRNELSNIYDSNHSPFFKYTYDASGNVQQRLGQRFQDSTVLTYDALNRPLTCAQNGVNGTNFATSHYDYNSVGNVKDTYRDEEAEKGDYFTYDALNQASSAIYSATSASDPSPAKSVSYGLSLRNRTSMTVTDNILHTTTTTNYTPNDLNQYTSISVSGSSQSLLWDNNFNLSGYSGWGYTYDAENRLISVAGNGHTATFTYDALGRCVKRVLDGAATIFTYDEWTPVAEWDGSGNLVATNVYGLGDDELVYRSAGTTQLFYKSDPMGNVMFLLDQNGSGIEKYKYDAFGSPTITDWNGNVRTASAYGNRFMFGSRDYVSALGLYDMRNRVYDPSMGRFYQTDPIGFAGDSWNLYRFCGNNPLLGGDPTGLDGLDTGFDLSADQFAASGDFSDLSSDYDASLETGIDPLFAETASIDDQIESSYETAGSDNPNDYVDVSSFSGEPSSLSAVTESTTLETSSTNFSAVTSTSTEVQAVAVTGTESTAQSDGDFLRTIGLVKDFSEVANKSLTGRAERLQKAGKFSLYGREYKLGYYGNQSVNYSALKVGAARIRQAKLIALGRNVTRVTGPMGVILAVMELNDHGFSTRQVVRTSLVWGGSYAALKVEPPFGPGIAIGILVTDALGGFDGLYNYFDDTPRFKLQNLFGPPTPTKPAGK